MSDVFKRIKNNEPLDTEEIRRDICVTIPDGISYHGIAPAQSATSDLVWSVVKITNDCSGNPMLERLFTNVAWDDRNQL